MINIAFPDFIHPFYIFFPRRFCISPNAEVKTELLKTEKTVRLFFLLEEHKNIRDREKNVLFLKENYSFENGDVILVEDDCLKEKEELNLEQIQGFSGKKFFVEGWDPHESCEERVKINALLIQIFNASKKIHEGDGRKKDVKLLFKVAQKVQIKALKTVEQYSPQELLAKPELKEKREDFAAACIKYTENARNHICLKHFETRQEALIKKIEECLQKKPNSRIFVMAGKNHLDKENEAVSNSVLQLTSFLKGKQYKIV